MTLEKYTQFVLRMWIDPLKSEVDPGLAVMALGLAGESGEVLEHIKKFIRDGKIDKDALVKELGDSFYYWVRICSYFEIDPTYVIEQNVAKLESRLARNVIRGSGDNR